MEDIKRAIETLKNKNQYMGIDYSNGKDVTCVILLDKQAEEAIKALEKQIPKKLIELRAPQRTKVGNIHFGTGCKLYKCPSCGTLVSPINKYCGECGQKVSDRK